MEGALTRERTALVLGRLGWLRSGRGLSWGVVVGSVLLLATVVTGVAATPRAGAATTATSPSCGKAVGPFSVHGAHVLGRGGKVFVSYGITVPGLGNPDWWAYQILDQEQIAATAEDWCANTVRLQVNQDSLVGNRGTSFNKTYMAAIESEVSLAESYRLVVVINDETNFAIPSVENYQQGPTPGTETFWKDMAHFYGHDPQVIFDLFNEPRLYSPGMPAAQEWQLWMHGGYFEGANYSFGMVDLAKYLRYTVGARNLFWVQGPRYSRTFAGMVKYGAVLHVSGVVYAIHHPMGPQTASFWYHDFGYLIEQGIAPVVDGEWSNREPAPVLKLTTIPGYCWPGAPTTVPEYLNYLSAHGVGMSAFELQPGVMIQSWGDMAQPNTINAKTWSCWPQDVSQPGQGAGAEIMAWFRQHNR
jgi:Cellulase (glycosyl hydrolase family 5)